MKRLTTTAELLDQLGVKEKKATSAGQKQERKEADKKEEAFRGNVRTALNGQVVVRRIMNLSSSWDHRVVDGHDGATLVQLVKSYLEHPATIFM